MPTSGRRREEERVARQKRRASLTKDFLEQTYSSQRELAVRYGVSDSLICQELKIIREILKEEMTENAKVDRDRRIKQHEAVIGKAAISFEKSKQNHEEISTRYEKRMCRKCRGKQEVEGAVCDQCEGKGYNIEEVVTRKVVGQAGDPRFLGVIQKGLMEIARLMGYYPEKTTTKKVLEEKSNILLATVHMTFVRPQAKCRHKL